MCEVKETDNVPSKGRSVSLLTFILGVMLVVGSQEVPAQDAPEGAPGKSHLARFIGTWEGIGDDGQFREVTSYHWGPGAKHMIVQMKFYQGDHLTGEGSGFMVWDVDNDGLVFHMVSSHGTVVQQTQTGGNYQRMEMAAKTVNGAATGFPLEFRTHIEFTNDAHYESGVWLLDENDEWLQVMRNRFHKLSTE